MSSCSLVSAPMSAGGRGGAHAARHAWRGTAHTARAHHSPHVPPRPRSKYCIRSAYRRLHPVYTRCASARAPLAARHGTAPVSRRIARAPRRIVRVATSYRPPCSQRLPRLCDRAIACSRLSGLPACPLRRPPSSWPCSRAPWPSPRYRMRSRGTTNASAARSLRG